MRLLSRGRIVFVVLVVALLGLSSDGAAQQRSIAGTVTDSSGVIPGATVVLSSGSNEVSRTVTDATGNYHFDRLAPGTYEMAVSMRGFEPAVRNITIAEENPTVD